MSIVGTICEGLAVNNHVNMVVKNIVRAFINDSKEGSCVYRLQGYGEKILNTVGKIELASGKFLEYRLSYPFNAKNVGYIVDPKSIKFGEADKVNIHKVIYDEFLEGGNPSDFLVLYTDYSGGRIHHDWAYEFSVVHRLVDKDSPEPWGNTHYSYRDFLGEPTIDFDLIVKGNRFFEINPLMFFRKSDWSYLVVKNDDDFLPFSQLNLAPTIFKVLYSMGVDSVKLKDEKKVMDHLRDKFKRGRM